MSTVARGRAYELQAAEILRAQGFTVKHLAAERYHDSDLELEPGILLEVKGSLIRRINNHARGYTFVLQKVDFNLPISEHALVLLCRTEHGDELFIIPRELASGHYLSITSADLNKYRGKYAHYRNAFSLLDELGAERKLAN